MDYESCEVEINNIQQKIKIISQNEIKFNQSL